MKMTILSLIITALAPSAFASHPHDRVCVGSAPRDFILQYSVGRTYENGNPNLDSHKIAVEASRSAGDYMDLPSTKFTSKAVIVKPGDLEIIPVVLMSANHEIMFNGSFDVNNETLIGVFGSDTAQVTSKLTCVSQPRTTLKTSGEDIAL
jgi:hypothetical protein